MDHLHVFNDLPHIQYSDENFSAHSRWLYHSQASPSLISQPPFNRSPMLAGIGLHSDADEYDFPLMEPTERWTQGLNDSPFSSEHLYADRKMSDFAIYPPYDTTLPELYHRHGSPLTEASSPSQSCDTFSASHTDELHHHYSIDFRGSISSPVDFNQGCFPHNSYEDFSRRSSEIPLGGGCSISLDKIQNFQDTAYEHEQDHGDSELDADCDSEHECRNVHDIPMARTRSVMPYTEDEGLGQSIKDESIRDSMSERFDDEEEEDDPEYNPKSCHRSPKATRTRPTTSRRNSHGRKLSTASAKGRVSKPKTKKPSSSGLLRPFPCPLAAYGCQSTFTSKNEWKRHVSTQHIKLGFWRCDMCPPTDPHNIVYNDFNRKDLFTQHLRRMHATHQYSLAVQPAAASLPNVSGQVVISDEAIQAHQERCYIQLRSNPPRSGCLFCSRTFLGDGAWEERMEHVGAHFEQERKRGVKLTGPEDWREDAVLQHWLEQEGLIEQEQLTGWHIGDGRPRRHDSVLR
jgi:hypothetical protein